MNGVCQIFGPCDDTGQKCFERPVWSVVVRSRAGEVGKWYLRSCGEWAGGRLVPRLGIST